jgi:dihydrofolate reductase
MGTRKRDGNPETAAARRVRYSVAMSLDGYIAGPEGEADWIVMDPEIDFKALFADFDTIFVGRRSFEAMAGQGGGSMPGMKTIVFSKTLRQSDYPKLTIVSGDEAEALAALREKPGKDIWLFGGGLLFRSLLDKGLVDGVEVAIVPVLLGGGIPLLPSPAKQAKLTLTRHRIYQQTGIVFLEYSVNRESGRRRVTRTRDTNATS